MAGSGEAEQPGTSDRAESRCTTVGATTGGENKESHGRAQTTLDFAIGTSVFLLVLIAMVQFVPGMLQPFNVGAQEETVAVDRVSSQLAGGLLGDPANPYTLNTTCTREFFDGNSPSFCRYSGSSLNDRLGLKSRQFANVTLRGNITGTDGADILCWDGSAGTLIERQDADCTPSSSSDVVFAAGPQPRSGSISTVTGRRAVSIEGNATTLIVEMW